MDIPRTHPRYKSLMLRHLLEKGVEDGLVTPTGLIAHGRGEAFDYLLGERTPRAARAAARAAASILLLAEHPVISVNGNSAVLAPDTIRELAAAVPCIVEVNLFYRTPKRIELLVEHLEGHGICGVLGRNAGRAIPGLDSQRGVCEEAGIASADVVFLMLEDGDRTMALRRMGKTVISVDLNPLSRTARAAHVNITDELTRALPLVCAEVERLRGRPRRALERIAAGFESKKNLMQSLAAMRGTLARPPALIR